MCITKVCTVLCMKVCNSDFAYWWAMKYMEDGGMKLLFCPKYPSYSFTLGANGCKDEIYQLKLGNDTAKHLQYHPGQLVVKIYLGKQFIY